MNKSLKKKLVSLGFAMLAPLVATSAFAQVSGAIFTTNDAEVPVNMNIYPSKDVVYLNGGPRVEGSTASALPDGVYYFQVTEPNGALLSTDNAECRQVRVTDGRFAADTPVGSCPHASGAASVNGGVGIQLVPYNTTSNAGGEYKVWLISQAEGCVKSVEGAVLKFKNSCTKTDNFKVEEEDDPTCTTCGTENKRTIGGVKYYDANANSTFDETEATVAGVVINVFLSGNDVADYTMPTDESGAWLQQLTVNTPYKVCEVMPLGTWMQTGPATGSTTTTGTAVEGVCWEGIASANDFELDFGNLCLGAGNGHTLGFWQNKNGQALITSTMLATLSTTYNLKNAAGGDFDTNQKSALGKFLTSASATNMANMLSAQLAAMYLNTVALNPAASTSALIYAPGTASANPLGFATLGAVMAEANASLAANPLTIADSPARTLQTALKNALDKGNNNLNFVQATACAVTYPAVQ
jgi:hypothetical protein